MDYRIEPTRLGRGSGRAVLVGVSVVVLLLGALVVILGGDSPGDATAAVRPTPTPRPAIACHGVVAPACERVADAAVAAIDDPTLPGVRAIGVWPSLLCGDAFDCPPGRLARGRVAGSAVLELSDARTLWVNVTEADEGALEAWVIRAG